MAFNREAARNEGYSDEEIDTYLASKVGRRQAPGLAEIGSRAAVDLATYPLTNPLAIELENLGERINSSVQDVAGRTAEAGFPLSAGVMSLVSEWGKLTPTNIALNVGGEVFGRLGASAVALGAKKAGGYLSKKGISAILGPSEEATTAALRDPSVLSATVEDVTRGLPRIARKFDEKIKVLRSKAGKSLSTSRFLQPTNTPGAVDAGGAFTKDEVFAATAKARRKLGGIYTDEGRAAEKTIGRIEENLGKIRNTVSQKQVHDLVGLLDDEIPWDKVWRAPETLTATDRALIDTRTALDAVLKGKNHAYAEAIKPVEEAIRGRGEFVKKFGIQKIKGEGWVASDQAYQRTRSALREGKLDTERILAQTKNILGEDLSPSIQKAVFGEEFRGGKASGSRSVNQMAIMGGSTGGTLGAMVAGTPGAAVGGAIGGATGAATGSYIDRKGGEIAADLIRKYLGVLPTARRVSSVAGRIIRPLPFMSPLAIAARIAAQSDEDR